MLLFVVEAVGLSGEGQGQAVRLSPARLLPADPPGTEVELLSLYQEAERGTSWYRMLVFGLVHRFTHSSRWAILALIVSSSQVAFVRPGFGCVRASLLAKWSRRSDDPLPHPRYHGCGRHLSNPEH